jgi:hypothetical protein
MRCYPKVPEIRLPMLNNLSTFLFASISFEIVPFCVSTAIPVGFPRSEALLEVILHQHLHHILQFGLDLFNDLKTSLKSKAATQGVTCGRVVILQGPGIVAARLCQTFSVSHLRTSQRQLPFTVCPGRTNSLCTMPSVPKKKNNSTLILHCFELVVLSWVVVNFWRLPSSTEMIAASSQGHIHKPRDSSLAMMVEMNLVLFSLCFLSSEQTAMWCSFWSLLSSLGTDLASMCCMLSSCYRIR